MNLDKAIRLEYRAITSNKFAVILLFFQPIVIMICLGIAGSSSYQIPGSMTSMKVLDTHASYIFAISLIYLCAQMTMLRIVGERKMEGGTLDRELLGIKRSSHFLGKFFANALFAFVQCLLLLMVGFLFDLKIQGSGLVYFILLFVTALFGLSLGLTISVFSKTKLQAAYIVPMIVVILIIFSGILIPLDSMPITIRSISENLPLTSAADALFTVQFDRADILDIILNFMTVILWTFFILIMGLIKYSYEKG